MEKKLYQPWKAQRNYRYTYYYQKSETLYQMTHVFCQRFLTSDDDATIDRMLQDAHSARQNIIDTSDRNNQADSQIQYLNLSRTAIQDLRELYRSYIVAHGYDIWNEASPRFEAMHKFCSTHNRLDDYRPFLNHWNDEEIANVALTLCHQTDTMLHKQIQRLQPDNFSQGVHTYASRSFQSIYTPRTSNDHYQDQQTNQYTDQYPNQQPNQYPNRQTTQQIDQYRAMTTELEQLREKCQAQEAEIARLQQVLNDYGILD